MQQNGEIYSKLANVYLIPPSPSVWGFAAIFHIIVEINIFKFLDCWLDKKHHI